MIVSHATRALLCVVALACALTATAQWSFQDVDGLGRVDHTSVALASTGETLIAYGSDALRVARETGAAWSIEEVDNEGCAFRWPSLVVAALDDVWVSYYDVEAARLKLAHFGGSAWSVEVVDSDGDVGVGSSLVLDARGYPVISYHDETGSSLKLARFDGAAWSLETIGAAGPTGYGTSVALDSSGNPLVSFLDEDASRLKLARWDGAVWSIESLSFEGIGSDAGTSLVLDSSGNPHIGYVGGASARLARWTGTDWEFEAVESGSIIAWSRLVLDSADNPSMAYATGPGDLRYAAWDGSAWQVETVERGDDVSLALDSLDRPVIAMHDRRAPAGLLLARWDGSEWASQAVHVPGDTGSHPSLAVAPAGYPAASYREQSSSSLKYARLEGGTWLIETVETGVGGGGAQTSLAFDNAGRPAVATYDATTDDLLLARWDGADWIVEIVDSAGDVGDDNALALDASDNPFISYYDKTNDDLKLARWDGSAWLIETVDSDGDVGSSSSIALDSLGHPAVSYYDRTNRQLKLARWDGSAWSIEVLDTDTNWVGQSTSLASDEAGNLMLSYSAWNAVRYAYWDGSQWAFEDLDTASARDTSLARGPADSVAVAWLTDTGALKLARSDGSGWLSETVEDRGLPGLSHVSLGLSAVGEPHLVYRVDCSTSLRYAGQSQPVVLFRGLVADLTGGWKSVALPLSELNDDETPPFPVVSERGAGFIDSAPPAVALVLYRVLLDGTADLGNTLRAGKPSVDPVGVALDY